VRAAVSKDHCIPSAWVVRGLAQGGPVHACQSCGARMFVRYASGLCPLCWNGRGPERAALVTHVAPERALAGVLDDPAIEADPGSPRSAPPVALPAPAPA
jgi:hypothetical protein